VRHASLAVRTAALPVVRAALALERVGARLGHAAGGVLLATPHRGPADHQKKDQRDHPGHQPPH
jgi:hypothetical protein